MGCFTKRAFGHLPNLNFWSKTFKHIHHNSFPGDIDQYDVLQFGFKSEAPLFSAHGLLSSLKHLRRASEWWIVAGKGQSFSLLWQCVTNILIYLNIQFFFYRILDIWKQILKFSPTNICGYSNTWSTIFELLIIQIFLEIKLFHLFEALFEADVVIVLSQNTQWVELESQKMCFLTNNFRNIQIFDDFNKIFKYFQNSTDEYIHIRIRPKVDISNIFVFVAQLNICHTLFYGCLDISSDMWTEYFFVFLAVIFMCLFKQ